LSKELKNINLDNFSLLKQLLFSVKMLPALLNRRSLGTEVPTIDKYLIAILYKLGYIIFA